MRPSQADTEYLSLLRRVVEEGVAKENRTGVLTYSIFGGDLMFDLHEGFPLLTTKKVNFRAVVAELLWFISGNTNIQPLLKQGVKIWTEWPFKRWATEVGVWDEFDLMRRSGISGWKERIAAFERKIVEDDEFAAQYGDLGPVYGHQWRHFGTGSGEVDQLQGAIDLIKKDPGSRRIVINSWNPVEIPEMVVAGLPPCHLLFQFYVLNGRLSCALNMRSADMFLGVPFNIASYAALTHAVAALCGLDVGQLKVTMTDCHVYENHLEACHTQLARKPFVAPRLAMVTRKTIDDYGIDDFQLMGYTHHAYIPAEVAI